MRNKSDERWTEHFNIYKEYVTEHSKFPVSTVVYRGNNTGQWFHNQIAAFKNGTMPQDRLKKMDEFNPNWRGSRETLQDENKRLMLSSNWQQKLRTKDVPIDRVFSSDDLYDCLSHEIYSCRDYFEYFEKHCSREVWRESVKQAKWNPSLFSLEHRLEVFETAFPNLDFSSFNIYFALSGNLDGSFTSFYDAASFYSSHSPFHTADDMCSTFNHILDTLGEKEAVLLVSKYSRGMSLRSIAEEQENLSYMNNTIEARAVRKLRHPSRFRRIRPIPSDHILTAERAAELIRANNGNLDLSGTEYEKLPADFHVPGSVILSRTKIRSIPDTFTFGGSLHLDNIAYNIKFPNSLRCIEGDLDISCSPISSIPNSLTVLGNLTARNTLRLQELGAQLTVQGDLDICDTPICVLPSDMQVGGHIYAFQIKKEDAPSHLQTKILPHSPQDISDAERAAQITIYNLDLSIRSYNALERAGIKTVADLLQRTKNDLLQLRNLGAKSVDEIIQEIEKAGFAFDPAHPGALNDIIVSATEKAQRQSGTLSAIGDGIGER